MNAAALAAAMDRERFAEIMASAPGWNSIDSLVELLDESNYWTADFLETAERGIKTAFVRRTIKTLRDDSKFPVWASVETTSEDGKPVRVYKQEALFDVEDYRQVVQYHTERASHHRRMATGYARRCEEKLGVQLRLGFDQARATKPR